MDFGLDPVVVEIGKKIVTALPETDYFDVTLREGAVVLRPVAISEPGTRLATVRRKIKDLGLPSKDIDDAIRWARARRRPS